MGDWLEGSRGRFRRVCGGSVCGLTDERMCVPSIFYTRVPSIFFFRRTCWVWCGIVEQVKRKERDRPTAL